MEVRARPDDGGAASGYGHDEHICAELLPRVVLPTPLLIFARGHGPSPSPSFLARPPPFSASPYASNSSGLAHLSTRRALGRAAHIKPPPQTSLRPRRMGSSLPFAVPAFAGLASRRAWREDEWRGLARVEDSE
ncbi:hypothetical protein K438DRAFT_2000478 [Mycena galopus ATCC 62051]|nr:hypothetical protein K438DRAFT_2000478 [Mycena galopus ATCC 62051]